MKPKYCLLIALTAALAACTTTTVTSPSGTVTKVTSYDSQAATPLIQLAGQIALKEIDLHSGK